LNILLIFLSFLNIYVCGGAAEYKGGVYKGTTMGTSFTAKWHNIPQKRQGQNNENLPSMIENKLKKLNQIYSTFDKNSELSKINSVKTTKPIEISKTLYMVIKEALSISKLSDGTYDVTIGPLVDFWGFGSKDKKNAKLPSKQEILKIKENTGYKKIVLINKEDKYFVRKINPDIQINLSSIAKGHAVDEIARLIKKEGWINYLVEIGGEIVTAGVSNSEKNWRAGINLPDKKAALDEVLSVVEITDKALATSGTYRNYFTIEDKTFSHILNGKTGYPTEHKIVSVSIIAKSCMQADALATMALVLGRESISLLDKDGIEYLFLESTNSQDFTIIKSKNWPQVIDN